MLSEKHKIKQYYQKKNTKQNNAFIKAKNKTMLSEKHRIKRCFQVTMDIAVGQASGGPLAQGAEECRCPPGNTYIYEFEI